MVSITVYDAMHALVVLAAVGFRCCIAQPIGLGRKIDSRFANRHPAPPLLRPSLWSNLLWWQWRRLRGPRYVKFSQIETKSY